MLTKSLPLLFALTSTAAATCEWLGGGYGVDVECLPGWVATGACGSGRRSDCTAERGPLPSKYHFMVQCCQTKNNNYLQTNCVDSGYKYGNLATCPQGQALFGGCGSGMNADCKINGTGSKYYFVTRCCEDEDITVSDPSYCDWKFGNYGDLITCPSGYAASGYCGSGGNADCPSGSKNSWAGVYCCPYTDNRS